ncbi:hypothetical protein [Agrococcus jenensis]|uniref:Uncharacterized protein n=1 Tax=Agrococcus jenensis TaxID=46353 RepID=A0A3N2AQR4_9MICO|nr:hypothetical protein [Agrococcus jenensis]ROR65377.1 hypothetical protein EDD26_0743 [Agrococcus jenensis]
MTDASQSGDELQPGGTTGAEHDGRIQQVAAESQDALDEALDGPSPWGADRPISGEPTDPLAGSGAPTEGAGEPQQAVAADDDDAAEGAAP